MRGGMSGRWRVRGREGEQGECGREKEGMERGRKDESEGEKGESEKVDWEVRVRGRRTERWRVRGEKN